jgi:hypothetical protein
MGFPCFLHRSDGESFLCPNQEFLDSLRDKERWTTEPYTGPRAVLLDQNRAKECKKCALLKEEIIKLKLRINELEQETEAPKEYESSFAKKNKAKAAKENG